MSILLAQEAAPNPVCCGILGPVVAGFIIGIIGASGFELLRVWVVRKFFGPRLKLLWDKNRGIVGPIERTEKEVYSEYYARLIVTNEGWTVASHCTGYLTDVKTVDEDGKLAPTLFNDYLPLRWSYLSEEQSRQGINLHAQASYYLDIFHSHSENRDFHPRIIPQSPRYDGLFREVGTYFFKIEVFADSAKRAEQTIYIKWNGEWDKLVVATDIASLRSLSGEEKNNNEHRESDIQKAARLEQWWLAATMLGLNAFLLSEKFPKTTHRCISILVSGAVIIVAGGLSWYAICLIANRAIKYDNQNYRKPAFHKWRGNVFQVMKEREGALFFVLLIFVSFLGVLMKFVYEMFP